MISLETKLHSRYLRAAENKTFILVKAESAKNLQEIDNNVCSFHDIAGRMPNSPSSAARKLEKAVSSLGTDELVDDVI